MDRGEVSWALLMRSARWCSCHETGPRNCGRYRSSLPQAPTSLMLASRSDWATGRDLRTKASYVLPCPAPVVPLHLAGHLDARRLDRASRKTVTGKAPRARGRSSARPTRVAPRRRQAQSPSALADSQSPTGVIGTSRPCHGTSEYLRAIFSSSSPKSPMRFSVPPSAAPCSWVIPASCASPPAASPSNIQHRRLWPEGLSGAANR